MSGHTYMYIHVRTGQLRTVTLAAHVHWRGGGVTEEHIVNIAGNYAQPQK